MGVGKASRKGRGSIRSQDGASKWGMGGEWGFVSGIGKGFFFVFLSGGGGGGVSGWGLSSFGTGGFGGVAGVRAVFTAWWGELGLFLEGFVENAEEIGFVPVFLIVGVVGAFGANAVVWCCGGLGLFVGGFVEKMGEIGFVP